MKPYIILLLSALFCLQIAAAKPEEHPLAKNPVFQFSMEVERKSQDKKFKPTSPLEIEYSSYSKAYQLVIDKIKKKGKKKMTYDEVAATFLESTREARNSFMKRFCDAGYSFDDVSMYLLWFNHVMIQGLGMDGYIKAEKRG